VCVFSCCALSLASASDDARVVAILGVGWAQCGTCLLRPGGYDWKLSGIVVLGVLDELETSSTTHDAGG
jgi:hypothetical protein